MYLAVQDILRCHPISRTFGSVLLITATATTSGCGQSGRRIRDMPPVEPLAAAEKAIELYDKSGDGSLNDMELAASPGIRAARDRYDTDGNHEVTKGEIAAHLTTLYSSGTPWMTVDCQIYQGGRPLKGATVRLVPDSFLKEALQPASGITDEQGRTSPAVNDEQLPADKRGLRIIQPGPYRVQIEHPSIKQTDISLGCDIDPTSRGGTCLVFRL